MENKELLNKMRDTGNKYLFYGSSMDQLTNLDFIVEVIKIFKDDFDFIDEVAEEYVKYIPAKDLSDNPQYIELCILLGQYVPEGHYYYDFYTKRLDNIYKVFLLHVMMIKDKVSGVSELGFSILMKEYGDRRNILDFFALRMMDELYHKHSCGNFEDLIHKYCDSPKIIRNQGYEQFFVRNLYGVDDVLGFYVFENAHLLKDFIQELHIICENWYEYEEKLFSKCVEVINDWVCKKKNNAVYGNDFDYQQAMNEILLKMNFCELFGINRREIFPDQNDIISFNSAVFKKDLKSVINKVLIENMTLTQLNDTDLDLDKEIKKKVLKK